MFSGLTFSVHGPVSSRQNTLRGLLVKHGATIAAPGQPATHALLPSMGWKSDSPIASHLASVATVVNYDWVTQCIKCNEVVPSPLPPSPQAEPRKWSKRQKLHAPAVSIPVHVEWSPVAALSSGAAMFQFQGVVASVLLATTRGTDHVTAYQLRDALIFTLK